jgi:hypothetical protein
MKDFKELKVWQKSHSLTLAVYKATETFPKQEIYGLTSGSASELEYHLLLSHDLALLKTSDYQQLASEVVDVKRMLTSFIQKLIADGRKL